MGEETATTLNSIEFGEVSALRLDLGQKVGVPYSVLFHALWTPYSFHLNIILSYLLLLSPAFIATSLPGCASLFDCPTLRPWWIRSVSRALDVPSAPIVVGDEDDNSPREKLPPIGRMPWRPPTTSFNEMENGGINRSLESSLLASRFSLTSLAPLLIVLPAFPTPALPLTAWAVRVSAPMSFATLPLPFTAVILWAFLRIRSSWGITVFFRAPVASWLAARLLSPRVWAAELVPVSALRPVALLDDAPDVEGDPRGEFESPSELANRDTIGTKPLLALRRLLIMGELLSMI